MAEQVGGIYYEVDLETGKMLDQSRMVNRELEGMATTAKKAAVAIAAAFSAAAIASQLKKAASAAAEFEKSAASLSAITGATGDQLKILTDAAKQFGLTSTTSGRDALEGMKLIASAKPELLQNAEALKQVTAAAVTLADASGMQLPEAATALSLALNQFGEGADQTTRYINVLAAGAKFGSSEIHETAAALKNTGVAAASAGVSFETTSAAIQALAEKGLKAGEAGTGLRSVLLKLENSTDKALKPSVNGLVGALENLAKKNLNSTEMTKLFGLESINAAQSLLTMRGRVADLETALTGTNVAYEQAAVNTATLAAKGVQLKNSLNILYTMIGERLLPGLHDTADAMQSGVVVAVENLDTIINTASTSVQALAAIFLARAVPAAVAAGVAIAQASIASAQASVTSRTAATGFEMLGVGAQRASVGATAAAASMGVLRSAMAFLGGPAGVVMLAAFAAYEFTRRSSEARQEALAFGGQIDKLAQSFRELNSVQALGRAAETADFIREQRKEVEKLDYALKKAGNELAELNRQGYDKAAAIQADEIAKLTAKREQAQTELNKAIELETQLREQARTGPAAAVDGGGAAPTGTTPPTGSGTETTGTKFDSTSYLEELKKRTVGELEQIEIVKQAELRKNAELLADGKITAQQAAQARELITAASYDKVRDVLINNAAEELRIEQQKTAALESMRAQANAMRIAGMSEEDQILNWQNERLTMLQIAREKDLENEQLYTDAIASIRAQGAEKLRVLDEQRVKDAEQKAAQERDAMAAGYAATADVVKAFAGEQSREYKAMLVASKAYAIAEIGIKQAQAAATAFASGDYWTAAIRVASVVAQFASLYSSVNGARRYGGTTSAGNLYRVNESGAPEMFTASNGNQYMMPTTSGRVTAADDLGGGSVQWTIQINNTSGAQVSASADSESRIVSIAVKQAVGEVANNFRNNTGPVWSAARGSTNIQGRTA